MRHLIIIGIAKYLFCLFMSILVKIANAFRYLSHNESVQFLKALRDANSHINMTSMGKSIEGRDIW
jgi:hypothetical protein